MVKPPTASKNALLFILCIFVFTSTFSQTTPPAIITQSVTWNKAGSPYLINTLITIRSNATVTIESGTKVVFYNGGQIQLYGSMYALGALGDSINFTGNFIEDGSDPESIIMNKGSKVILDYCRVENHNHFLEANDLPDSSILVSDSRFTKNIYCFEGSHVNLRISKSLFEGSRSKCINQMMVAIDNTIFNKNITALSNVTGSVLNCTFTNNTNGIFPTSSILLDSNKFINNSNVAMQFKSEDSPNTITNNLFENNYIGIQIQGNTSIPITVSNNSFINSTFASVENTINENFNFSDNCWGTADTLYIISKIIKKGTGKVNFQPLHPSCRGCNALPYASNDTLCSDSLITLNTRNAFNPEYEKYLWTSFSDLKPADSTSAITRIHNDSSAIIKIRFQLRITTSYCQDSSGIEVFVYPKNDKHCRLCLAKAGPDIAVCSETDTMLGANENNLFYTYSWSPSEGLTPFASSHPIFNLKNSGPDTVLYYYTLIVKDTAANCFARDTVKIALLSEYNMSCKGLPSIHIYNVITPNGDAQNQNFTIDNIQFYPGNEVSVYNRWGNKIMHRKNYTNDWDGNNVPDGVYYYIVTIPELSEEYKGDLTIKK